MGSKWPYRCCFMGCYFLDLFNIVRLKILRSSVYTFWIIELYRYIWLLKQLQSDRNRWLKIYTRVVQKSLSLTQKESEKDRISLFFNIALFDITAIDPTILKHCNSIMEEDGILVLQKLLFSTYGFIIASKMVTPQEKEVGRRCLLELLREWKTRMFSLFTLNLWFKFEPRFHHELLIRGEISLG